MTTTQHITGSDAAAFVEAWAAIWRDHDGERWPTLLHEDGVLRNPLGELARDDLPGYMAGLVAGIAEHQVTPLRWAATGDGVLIEWLMTGRISGAPLEVRGVDLFTLREGLIVEGVAYFDPAPLLTPPAGAPSTGSATRSGDAAPFDIRAFAVDYDRAWQSRDPDAIAARHAADGTYQLHVAGLPSVVGREAMRATFAASLANWREVSFTFDKAFYGDSFFVWQSTMQGILAQPLELGAITIPANGRTLSLRGVDVITLNADGLIHVKETHFDIVAAANQAHTE